MPNEYQIKNEDLAILERIRQGEEAALADLYDRYAPVLFGIAMRILRSVSDVEDILHDVFLQVWNKPDSCQNIGSSVGIWLIINTRSRAVSRILSKGMRQYPHHLNLNNITLFSEANLSQNELQLKAVDAFKKMTPDQRHILALICHEGFNVNDVTQILKISTDHVHEQITSGMKILYSFQSNK